MQDKVTLQEYQDGVARTCATTEARETTLMAIVGMIGELGEIADPLKKAIWHKHKLDIDHIEKEIGDLLWYLATLCNALDINLDHAMQGNVKKLQERYPDRFSSQKSIERVEDEHESSK